MPINKSSESKQSFDKTYKRNVLIGGLTKSVSVLGIKLKKIAGDIYALVKERKDKKMFDALVPPVIHGLLIFFKFITSAIKLPLLTYKVVRAFKKIIDSINKLNSARNEKKPTKIKDLNAYASLGFKIIQFILLAIKAGAIGMLALCYSIIFLSGSAAISSLVTSALTSTFAITACFITYAVIAATAHISGTNLKTFLLAFVTFTLVSLAVNMSMYSLMYSLTSSVLVDISVSRPIISIANSISSFLTAFIGTVSPMIPVVLLIKSLTKLQNVSSLRATFKKGFEEKNSTVDFQNLVEFLVDGIVRTMPLERFLVHVESLKNPMLKKMIEKSFNKNRWLSLRDITNLDLKMLEETLEGLRKNPKWIVSTYQAIYFNLKENEALLKETFIPFVKKLRQSLTEEAKKSIIDSQSQITAKELKTYLDNQFPQKNSVNEANPKSGLPPSMGFFNKKSNQDLDLALKIDSETMEILIHIVKQREENLMKGSVFSRGVSVVLKVIKHVTPLCHTVVTTAVLLWKMKKNFVKAWEEVNSRGIPSPDPREETTNPLDNIYSMSKNLRLGNEVEIKKNHSYESDKHLEIKENDNLEEPSPCHEQEIDRGSLTFRNS